MAWVRAVWQEKNDQVHQEGTVPNTWVDFEHMKLFWPAVPNAKKHMKERREPKSGWRQFRLIKEKMRSDDFQACEDYDLTSAAEAGGEEPSGKRQKKKRLYPEYVEDEEERGGQSEEEEDQGRFSPELPLVPQKVVLQSVRPKEKSQGTTSTPSSDQNAQKHQGKRTKSPGPSSTQLPEPMQPRHFSSEPELQEPELQDYQTDDSMGSAQSFPQVTPTKRKKSRNPTSTSTPRLQRASPYPMQQAKFQRKVLELLVSIRDGLQDLKLSSSQDESAPLPAKATTVEGLTVLDESLTSATERQHLINSLALIGGTTLRDNVKRVMEKLMSNDLMAKFNMKGKLGTKERKLSFIKLHLYSVVIESVQRSTKETEANISDQIAYCLKYAPDRLGGGGRTKTD